MPNTQLNTREKRLQEEISICREVERTLETKGWVEILGPLLEQMMRSLAGGKNSKGTYLHGDIAMAKNNDDRTKLVGGLEALTKYYNIVYDHIQQIEVKERALKDVATVNEGKLKIPLVDDTRY